MPLFAPPESTRRQWVRAGLHIAMLAAALIVAWQTDGPLPGKAFWAILSYFVEIAVVGTVEIVSGIFRGNIGAA
jgi:hypothetical protein